MTDYITENTLSDSYVFNMTNQNKVISVRVANAVKQGVPVLSDSIAEQLIQIQKTQISPLWNQVIAAYEAGDIKIIYCNEVPAKIPSAVPFFIMKAGTGVAAYVFLAAYTGIEKDGKSYDIPYKNLYVLMEGAYIALQYTKNPAIFTRNSGLMKLCMNMYTGMFTRLLNKEYALSLDSVLSNNVIFTLAKFFITKIWGIQNNDMATNYAMSACDSSLVDKAEIIICNNAYEAQPIEDLPDVINFLKTLSDHMGNLTLRYLTERWLNTFKQGGLLAMDCLPYLFFCMENMLLGTFLVNQTILRDIAKELPSVRNFYAELSKFL